MQNLGMQTLALNQSELLIEAFHVQQGVTLLENSGELKRGTVLGRVTASGKYAPFAPAASDGTQTPLAVLVSDTTIGTSAEPAPVYVFGVFNQDALVTPTLTAPQKTAMIHALRLVGLYAKPVI
jgi:hypothetical protein